MPTLKKEGFGTIYVWPDSSGSMQKPQFEKVVPEVKYVINVLKPERVVILCNDSNLKDIKEYGPGDEMDALDFVGRGGTDPSPAIRYAIEQGDCDMMICLSDMYFNYGVLPKPEFPTIWVSVSEVEKAPFGDLIRIPDDG